MNTMTIPKPYPHCPVPEGHPCFIGYVPAENTDIRRTFQRHQPHAYGDDYDAVERSAHLDLPGGFA
jgi:hypothetical protein